MSKKAILTKGIISSGKSTFAKQFVKDNPDYVRLSRDDFRHMIDGYSYSEETEKIVTSFMENCISELVRQNKNIIIDEQHLNEKRRNERIAFFKSKGYEVEIKEFPITLSEAIKRDKNREFSIGEKVIKRTWSSYEIQLKEMLERDRVVYKFDPSLPNAIISDLDGTLFTSPQRKIYDFKACINDKIVNQVKHILVNQSIINEYSSGDKVKIILLSGRDSVCREETIQSLHNNAVPYDLLYMRKEKDNRPDTVVKKELFDAYIRGVYNPLFVIDDRKCMVDLWVSMGLYCFDVSQDPYAKNDF